MNYDLASVSECARIQELARSSLPSRGDAILPPFKNGRHAIPDAGRGVAAEFRLRGELEDNTVAVFKPIVKLGSAVEIAARVKDQLAGWIAAVR
jgi:hypothetical protein